MSRTFKHNKYRAEESEHLTTIEINGAIQIIRSFKSDHKGKGKGKKRKDKRLRQERQKRQIQE